jgi:hypothetical protein
VTASAQQAVLRQAEHLGRRHGKAAVYWQTGDSDSDAALAFYRSLLRGADRDPQVTGLSGMPGLDGRQACDRASLAAGLGLARDDPILDQAAQAYLAAAREEFWQEAARLARRRLQSAIPRTAGQDGAQDNHRPGYRAEPAAVRALLDLHPAARRQDAPRRRAHRRQLRGLPPGPHLR